MATILGRLCNLENAAMSAILMWYYLLVWQVIPASISFCLTLDAQVKTKDSLKDLNALIESEKEAITLYTNAIRDAGEGLEKSIYEEILKDEQDHLEKLDALLKGYINSAQIK